MIKPEWILIKPCESCNYNFCKETIQCEPTCHYLDDHKAHKAAQRMVLEYLKTQRIHGQTFNEMLKELDDK
jgi:hypothetical protein